MLYYPQLSSGAGAQFPLRRRLGLRTVTNESSSGDQIRMPDAGARMTGWKLQYKNLNDAERAAIEQLFEACEGRLSTFIFLDPTDNLLQWSADWSKQAWTAGPMIQIAGGMADPVGGSAAMQVTNAGQGPQRVMQTTAGASWFQYCFSIYVRSDAPAEAKMVIASGGAESTNAIVTSATWTRITQLGGLTAKSDGISFGIELAAGERIYAFGAQVEGQASPGLYKPTTDRAGVYEKARFDSDMLDTSCEGVNTHSCTVQLVSGE